MCSLKFYENVCRICLEPNVAINWNDDIFEFYGISYKNCYYKYTRLEECDSDWYPTNLCETCANDLKNAHMLFENALESFNILGAALISDENNTVYSDTKICKSELEGQYQINIIYENNSDDNSSLENNSLIDIKNEISLLFATQTETEICSSNEIVKSEVVDMEPKYYINIQPSLEEITIDNTDAELLRYSDSNKIQEHESDLETSLQPLVVESFNNKSRKRCANKTVHKKIKQSKLTDPIEEQPGRGNGDVKAFVPKRRSKPREMLCQYCSFKAKGANQLRSHEATHREDRERNQTCPQCGLKMYTKLALGEHMKIHDKHRQKNHKCEFCEKAFFNKGALNVHRRIHLGLMVKCQICLREFYRQVDLNKHLLTHAVTPLQKSYHKQKYTVHCNYCNKSVLTHKWKQHKAFHLNQPQMKCTICDKNFFSRSNCTQHIRNVHHNSDYDQFIYYYSDCYSRMSHLMITQQEKVQPVTK